MFSGDDWAILILLLIAAVRAICLMARGTISGPWRSFLPPAAVTG